MHTVWMERRQLASRQTRDVRVHLDPYIESLRRSRAKRVRRYRGMASSRGLGPWRSRFPPCYGVNGSRTEELLTLGPDTRYLIPNEMIERFQRYPCHRLLDSLDNPLVCRRSKLDHGIGEQYLIIGCREIRRGRKCKRDVPIGRNSRDIR